MEIELRRLRHVVEVARAESVTAAAHSLAITQSALTKSIADVEARLGVALFQRLPRGMRTTEAGRAFVERARLILGDMDDLMARVSDLRGLRAGRLRLGFAPAIYQKFVNPALVAFAARHPGIRIEIVSGSAQDLVPQLMGAELDLLFGTTSQMLKWPELQVAPLADFHCVFMVRKAHPLLELARIREVDVLHYPIVIPATVEPVHTDLTQVYARNGLPPLSPHYVCDDFTLIRDLIAVTDACSPVVNLGPDYGTLERDFVLLRDVVDMPTQGIAAVTSPARGTPPPVTGFLDGVRETFATAGVPQPAPPSAPAGRAARRS